MKNTNEIIQSLAVCAGPGCQGCFYEFYRARGRCIAGLMVDAHAALTAMQDRCARYAEEIMVLRQQLEEVRHD